MNTLWCGTQDALSMRTVVLWRRLQLPKNKGNLAKNNSHTEVAEDTSEIPRLLFSSLLMETEVAASMRAGE